MHSLSYGSDPSGLICSYLFRPGGSSRALTASETADWIAAADSAEGGSFVWLHFNLSNAAAERWMRQHLDLSDDFHEALHEGVRSTRIDHTDNTLVAVLNDVLFDFSFDAADISTLWLSASPHIVVTARTRPLRSVDHLRDAVRHGENLRSSAALLVHLLRDEADVLMRIVRDIAARVDTVEDRLLAGRLERNSGNLGALRRLLVRLQRLLAPEPAALFRLLNRPPSWMADQDVQDLRQSSEEFSTVLLEMASLQERIKLLQEEIATEISEQNNRSLFVLTVVSVLALPINIIAGLFGMNVGGIPLANDGAGFWIVVGIVVGFTAVAGRWAFRVKQE